MEQLWSAEALREYWVLSPEELDLLKGMSVRRGLVLGYYLKSFQRYARFPRLSDPVPEAVADFLGEQLGYRGPLPSHVPDRTDRHYRRLVSDHLRLRRFDRAASGEFVEWLVAEVLPDAPQVSALDERMTAWFLANRFIRPEQSRLNDFIFYGNGNELVSNRRDDHEISVLSLHLLQAAMVYVNTLMIQQVLRERSWREKMTARDMAALNPLPHGHFNPYGVFDLDMDERLSLEEMRMVA